MEQIKALCDRLVLLVAVWLGGLGINVPAEQLAGRIAAITKALSMWRWPGRAAWVGRSPLSDRTSAELKSITLKQKYFVCGMLLLGTKRSAAQLGIN